MNAARFRSAESAPVDRAWVTWAAIAVCVVIFLGLSRESNPDHWEALGKWGAPSPEKLWNGAYWALVSSALVHQAIWHLAFNMYWLGVLGTRLEQAIGHGPYLTLLVAAAVVSSGGELAASGTTGIGASGVVYAIFGFMLVLRGRIPAFREALSAQTVKLFVVWLVGCMIATYANIWQVGNAAHFCGLFFGMAVAGGLVLKYKRLLLVPLLVILVAGSLLPVFWCPWSVTWLGLQAKRAYEAGDHERAIRWYDQVIAKEPHAAWAHFNRGCSYLATGERAEAEADFSEAAIVDPRLASATLLGLQASQAYEAGDHAAAIRCYDRVIAKDPRAAWAYFNRGCSYFKTGERAKARADFAEASRLDPKYSVPREEKEDDEQQ